MPLESGRQAAMLSAAAGGAFYGFYHIALLALSGQPVTRRDLVHAGVNLACASLSGAVIAVFLGPALIAFLPWPALRDPFAVGFAIGMFGWELVGVAIEAVKRRVAGYGEGRS